MERQSVALIDPYPSKKASATLYSEILCICLKLQCVLDRMTGYLVAFNWCLGRVFFFFSSSFSSSLSHCEFPFRFNKFLMKEDQRKLFKSISSAQLQIIGCSIYVDLNVCHGTSSKKHSHNSFPFTSSLLLSYNSNGSGGVSGNRQRKAQQLLPPPTSLPPSSLLEERHNSFKSAPWCH